MSAAPEEEEHVDWSDSREPSPQAELNGAVLVEETGAAVAPTGPAQHTAHQRAESPLRANRAEEPVLRQRSPTRDTRHERGQRDRRSQRAVSPERRSQTRAFMGNLNYEVTVGDIADFLSDVVSDSDIKDIVIAVDRDTQRSRGFAHVEFNSSEALDRALRKHGEQFQGRTVKLDYATETRRDHRPARRDGPASAHRPHGGRHVHEEDADPDAPPPLPERQRVASTHEPAQETPAQADVARTVDVPTKKKREDPFGGARPREEVLKERKSEPAPRPKGGGRDARSGADGASGKPDPHRSKTGRRPGKTRGGSPKSPRRSEDKSGSESSVAKDTSDPSDEAVTSENHKRGATSSRGRNRGRAGRRPSGGSREDLVAGPNDDGVDGGDTKNADRQPRRKAGGQRGRGGAHQRQGDQDEPPVAENSFAMLASVAGSES